MRLKHVTILMLFAAAATAQTRMLDDFSRVSQWRAIASDGVTAAVRAGRGPHGACLRLDFAFHGGAGYAIAQRDIDLALPANYRFTFALRADAPVNTLEFKLLDTAGNVYWSRRPDFTWPKKWTPQTVRKRHIAFAWGPDPAKPLMRAAKVEFVVSAGTGGRGSIFIDDFAIETLPSAEDSLRTPVATASSAMIGYEPMFAVDPDPATAWHSAGAGGGEWLELDLGGPREFGGLVVDWAEDFAREYRVRTSVDGRVYTDAHRVRAGNGGRDFIALPESEAARIRIVMEESATRHGFGVRNIRILPVEDSPPNAFFAAAAALSPAGWYPKYFSGKQSYWTIVGAGGDAHRALIDEQGAIELDRGGFSLEPFVRLGDRLVTWRDAVRAQSLERGYLPIPTVTWTADALRLTVRAFVAGEPGRSSLVVTYRVENAGTPRIAGSLFVALRPFQVNPPAQFLNTTGGVARIARLAFDGRAFVADGARVVSVESPDGTGACAFDAGEIVEHIATGRLPDTREAVDPDGRASGAMRHGFELASREAREWHVVVPYARNAPVPVDSAAVARLFAETCARWEARLGATVVRLPGADRRLVDVYKSNLAYALVNRDGPAIEPGARAYARSWIRDGAMIAAALLRSGNAREAREFVDWYARHVYPSGKVPCVVDARGADPVPENDSNGEFLYAVREVADFTRDRAWLRAKFPAVRKAVGYIQQMRRERMTEPYRSGTPVERACYGLVPESISHEGYSAKPMHSYWDDFFCLRGLRDAADIARALGEDALEKEWRAECDDFAACVDSSVARAMRIARIDFVPGCVELGDFDATSTAIAVAPCGVTRALPPGALERTFDRWFDFFQKRKSDGAAWENYTPYELRIATAFVETDQRERAHALLAWCLHDMRPPEWNDWAEVVWRDRDAAKFIGDMPHTWVGAEYLRLFHAMFAYEDADRDALVVGAGVKESWVTDPGGFGVTNLVTRFGALSFDMRPDGASVICAMTGTMDIPAGGIVVRNPRAAAIRHAWINGTEAAPENGGVTLRALPATIRWEY